MTTSTPKAILFLGATGGCALSALRRSLEAGYTCIALCRTPATLTTKLNIGATPPANLRIDAGNAHDKAALARALVHPSNPAALVDVVVSAIGGAFSLSKWGLDDPNVCGTGMRALLDTMTDLRAQGKTGRPVMVGVSSTGLSEYGRDIPRALVPLYHGMLKGPHADKKVMEQHMIASGERWTIVRASWLTDGRGGEKVLRAGMEDPVAGKVESKVLGYTISREDVGRWIFENVIQGDGTWEGKVASICY